MAFTQDQHLIGVATNAGQDVLLLDSFSGQEGISQPFHVFLSMMSEIAEGNPAKVKPHDLVGTSMTVRIALSNPGDPTGSGYRYLTGFCDHFVKEREDENFAYYSASLVPWFSFLGYATNCRIFQDKDVPTIINLRLDPFERMGWPNNGTKEGSQQYFDWFRFEFWRFVFVQQVIAKEIQTFLEFPPMQAGSSFNLESVKAEMAKRLAQAEAASKGTGQ